VQKHCSRTDERDHSKRSHSTPANKAAASKRQHPRPHGSASTVGPLTPLHLLTPQVSHCRRQHRRPLKQLAISKADARQLRSQGTNPFTAIYALSSIILQRLAIQHQYHCNKKCTRGGNRSFLNCFFVPEAAIALSSVVFCTRGGNSSFLSLFCTRGGNSSFLNSFCTITPAFVPEAAIALSSFQLQFNFRNTAAANCRAVGKGRDQQASVLPLGLMLVTGDI